MDQGQQWELFGYDMRQVGSHWVAAWRSVLWSAESPVRHRLDEVVSLQEGTESALYHSGVQVVGAPFECEALLLPDELVLARTLRLPAAVEGDLEAALALELGANSPFSPDDTASGWEIISRDSSQILVSMVVVSKSAVMTWMGGQYDLHDAGAREIWADAGGTKVVVRGFGEAKRETRYRKRLLRSMLMIIASAVIVLLMAAFAVAAKRAELAQTEALAAKAGRDAASAGQMRNRIALATESASAARKLMALHPNPHYEIARLTRLLGDSAHVVQFSMNGLEIRLRGRAKDAAAVMQLVTNESDYAEVTAPQAIIKVANSGLEQFALNVTLSGDKSL